MKSWFPGGAAQAPASNTDAQASVPTETDPLTPERVPPGDGGSSASSETTPERTGVANERAAQERRLKAAREHTNAAKMTAEEKRAQHRAMLEFTSGIAHWSQQRDLSAEAAANRFINSGKLLQQIGKSDPKNKCFTAVVGDESAGKSVVCMALLKQVILDVKVGTGTTVRTHITQSCNLDQDDKFICSMSYKGRRGDVVELAKGNPEELLDKYAEVSAKNKAWNDKDPSMSKIDGENICHISISTKDPNLGLEIMDHAGFAVQDTIRVATTEAFKNTIEEHFIGRQNNATVLLCHAFNKISEVRSASVYPTLYKDFRKIDVGKLFLVVTKMDMMSKQDDLDSFAANMIQQTGDEGGRPKKNGLPEYTPSEILDFIKRELAHRTDANGQPQLPSHVKIYFVASYHGQIEDLAKRSKDPKERFDIFLNDDRKGQVKAEKSVFDPDPANPGALFDAKMWELAGIALKDATKPEEIEKVKKQCGMENLFQELLSRQASGVEDMTRSFADKIDRIVEAEWRKLLNAQDEFSTKPDMVACARLIMKKFVETFCVLTQDEPYTTQSSGYARQDIEKEIHQNIKEQWKTKRMLLGWDLKEEKELYKTLNRRGVFPPKASERTDYQIMYESYRIPDFGKFYGECVRYCIQEDGVKERNISTLLHRFLKDYALRSQGIRIPEVDPKELRKDQKMNPNAAIMDVKAALSCHIQDAYEKIYSHKSGGGHRAVERTEEGGTTYVAARAALCSIMHGQIVLELLKDVPHFDAVFGRNGAKRWIHGDLSFLGRLNSRSRIQNLRHPGGMMQTLRPEPTRYGPRAEDTSLLDMVKEALQMPQMSKNPLDDFFDIVIAQFFDKPFEDLEAVLDAQSMKCALSSAAYIPLSYHLGPLFVHQDEEFLQEYKQHNGKDHFPHKFIRDPMEEVHGRELSPQKYEDEDGQLFSGLSGRAERQIMSLNGTEKVTPKDRARILSSMINANKLPDAINAFENANMAGTYDTRWMNFVKQRQLSCAVKRTLDDVLQSTTAVLYETMHPTKIEVHIKEAWNRWESLVLGYPYAYVQGDRPAMYRFLNTDEVIQFLYRNRREILDCCLSTVSDRGESKESPPIEEGPPKVMVPELDHKIHQSPLFQHVCRLAADEDHHVRDAALHFIEALYKKWTATVCGNGGDGADLHSSARVALSEMVLEALLKRRYSNVGDNSNAQQIEVEGLENKYLMWRRVQASVHSFLNFIKEHKSKFSGSTINADHVNLHPEMDSKFAREDGGKGLLEDLRARVLRDIGRMQERVVDDAEPAGPFAEKADELASEVAEPDYEFERLLE